MTFYVAAFDHEKGTILWYTGLPGPGFVRHLQYTAKRFHDELSAHRVVKRLNEFTKMHGYRFATINQNCEVEHIIYKLRGL